MTPPTGTGGVARANHYQGETEISCAGKPGQLPLCSSTDGNGHTTSYAYDTAGNVTTVTPPAPLGATTRSYDALGEAVTVTDGPAFDHVQ